MRNCLLAGAPPGDIVVPPAGVPTQLLEGSNFGSAMAIGFVGAFES